jgi:hypothetical protein
MVDAAAALWSAVPTAGVTLTDMGPLNEDVNGANIAGELGPADHRARRRHALGHQLSARRDLRRRRLGDRRDLRRHASQPTSCQNNGVYVWIDNVNPDATIAHGVICSTASAPPTPHAPDDELRAGARLRPHPRPRLRAGQSRRAHQNGEPAARRAGRSCSRSAAFCGASGGDCIPNPTVLRYDDIAALNRIYPITAANLASFPGKQLTAANTVSIQGTVTFRTGYGMQGVNVVARPLDANGNPLYQYTVTCRLRRALQRQPRQSRHRMDDANGNPLTMWGSNDPALQGFFDLSGIPLPPGVTTANYQVTFEAINPALHPRKLGRPLLDGQVALGHAGNSISVPNLSAGQHANAHRQRCRLRRRRLQRRHRNQAQPRPMPTGGMWCGRLSQVGQTDWFTFPCAAIASSPSSRRRSTKPARPRTPRPCPPSASGTHSIPPAHTRGAAQLPA